MREGVKSQVLGGGSLLIMQNMHIPSAFNRVRICWKYSILKGTRVWFSDYRLASELVQ